MTTRLGAVRGRWRGVLHLGYLLAFLLPGQSALAQVTLGTPRSVQIGFATDLPPESVSGTDQTVPPPPPIDPNLQQASCSSCGGGVGSGSLGVGGGLNSGPPAHPGHPKFPHPDDLFRNCCGFDGCFPGRKPCHPHRDHPTAVGRFLGALYDCLCCQDPCYEGHWVPNADAAFFPEAPRPVTQQRIRWDAGTNVIFPDRAEYFWARADGQGRGPRPRAPFLAVDRLRYSDFSLYTETAIARLGIIVEMPYRSVDPDRAPHAAGFGDMNIATKTLLYDCELLQVAFIMRTYLPVGSPGKGLGVGHVSLEPSLAWAIKLTPDFYMQGQIAEWIPISGDPEYAGAVFRTNLALTHTIWRILPSVPLIGTVEMNTWTFQDGHYTDPFSGPFQQASGETYISLGWGLRMFVCDRIDIGWAMETSLTSDHLAGTLYRTEFRWRY